MLGGQPYEVGSDELSSDRDVLEGENHVLGELLGEGVSRVVDDGIGRGTQLGDGSCAVELISAGDILDCNRMVMLSASAKRFSRVALEEDLTECFWEDVDTDVAPLDDRCRSILCELVLQFDDLSTNQRQLRDVGYVGTHVAQHLLIDLATTH